MPKIKEIQSQVGAAGPIGGREATASDFGAGIGAGVQDLGRATMGLVDAVNQRNERVEVSDTSAKIAKADADFTQRLQKKLREASPDEIKSGAFTDNFLQEYDQEMDKIAEGLQTRGGKEYFAKAKASQRSDFAKHSFMAQSELAGIKAGQDYETRVNSFSNSLMSKPSGYDEAIRQNQLAMEESIKAGQNPDVAMKMKQNADAKISEAAVRGWIRLNPQYAETELNSGRWDSRFSEDVKHQLYGELNMAKNAERIDAERRKQAQQEAFTARESEAKKDYLKKIFGSQEATPGGQPEKGNEVTAKQILQDGRLSYGAQKELIGMVEARNEKPWTSDNETFISLMKRIDLPDGHPDKILDDSQLLPYVYNKKISWDGKNSFQDLSNILQGKSTMKGREEHEALAQIDKIAEGQLTKIDPITGKRDPKGDALYLQATQEMRRMYKEGRKEGKSVATLTDPTSKDFVGRNFGNYRRKAEDIISDIYGQTQQQIQQSVPKSQGGEAPPVSDKEQNGWIYRWDPNTKKWNPLKKAGQ